MLLKIVVEGYNTKREGCDGLLWRLRQKCVSQLWHKKGDKRKLESWKTTKDFSPLLCTYTTIRSKTTISMSLMKFKVGSTAYLGNEMSLEWRSENVTTKERSLPGIVKPGLLTAAWRFSWILYAMKILNNVINLNYVINETLDLKRAVQSQLHSLCICNWLLCVTVGKKRRFNQLGTTCMHTRTKDSCYRSVHSLKHTKD